MALQKRNELSVPDILQPDRPYVYQFSKNDITHRQDIHQLHRYPEVVELLQDMDIEYARGWNFFRFVEGYGRHGRGLLPIPQVLDRLHSAFADNERVAIVLRNSYVEVTSSPMYIDEDFATLRNRMLFVVRDILEIPHGGRGEDSIMLRSKYSGTHFVLRQE